jgi:hypothetical protein
MDTDGYASFVVCAFTTSHASNDKNERKKIVFSTHGSPRGLGAHGIEETILPPDGGNLLNHEEQEETTTSSEVYVVDLEWSGELHGIATAHDLAQTEDGGQISDQARNDHGRSRERGDTGLVGHKVVWQVPSFGNYRQQSIGERGHCNECE